MRKPAIPASILRYGSILIAVTFKPKVFRSRPDEEAESTYAVSEDVKGLDILSAVPIIPLPTPEITPVYKVNAEDSRNK
jgi:hypothetical protein